MKSILRPVHALCAALAALDIVATASPIIQQQPLTQAEAMATPEGALKVPGHNNATYGPVPKADQLFEIEFLEIAPSPLPADQIFFLLLRGEIPASKQKELEHLDNLATASLSITLFVVLPDGEREDPKTYTVPLRTIAFGDAAHLSIRNAEGAYVDYLTSSGYNDILTDTLIPELFVQAGTWTFDVLAELGDGTCLFAISLTQWLEGRFKP